MVGLLRASLTLEGRHQAGASWQQDSGKRLSRHHEPEHDCSLRGHCATQSTTGTRRSAKGRRAASTIRLRRVRPCIKRDCGRCTFSFTQWTVTTSRPHSPPSSRPCAALHVWTQSTDSLFSTDCRGDTVPTSPNQDSAHCMTTLRLLLGGGAQRPVLMHSYIWHSPSMNANSVLKTPAKNVTTSSHWLIDHLPKRQITDVSRSRDKQCQRDTLQKPLTQPLSLPLHGQKVACGRHVFQWHRFLTP